MLSLTVEEHIWFYGRLKGLDKHAVEKEISQMIRDTGLEKKRQDKSANLSGEWVTSRDTWSSASFPLLNCID